MAFLSSFKVMNINNSKWNNFLIFAVFHLLRTVMEWLGLAVILIMTGLFLVTGGVKWLSSLQSGKGRSCWLRRFIVTALTAGILLFWLMEVIKMWSAIFYKDTNIPIQGISTT